MGSKKFNIIGFIAIAVIMLSSLSLIAYSIPNSLTLQGRLTNTAGTAQQGTFNFTFAIYDNTTSGNKLWEVINQSVTTDANGVYDTILRGMNLSFADQLYLGIAVQGENESVPRINLTSTPYSFRANISESLNANASYFVANLSVGGNATIGGGSANRIDITTKAFNFSSSTGNLNINGTVTAVSFVGDGSQLTGISAGSSPFNSSGTNIYFNNTNANLGLGTISPSERLTIIGNVNISGYLNISGDLIVNKQFNVTASNGNVNVAGILDAAGLRILGNVVQIEADAFKLANFTSNLQTQNASLWNRSSTNIYPRFIDDNVGIGTTAPGQKLHVIGTANITQAVTLANVTISRTVINTTQDNNQNLTISSAAGSVIIRLG